MILSSFFFLMRRFCFFSILLIPFLAGVVTLWSLVFSFVHYLGIVEGGRRKKGEKGFLLLFFFLLSRFN